MSEWVLILWLAYSKGVGLTNIPVANEAMCAEILRNWNGQFKGGYCINTATGKVLELKK